MLLNFSLSQLVLSSPSDVLCKVLPLSDSGCRIKVVLNNFCTAAVKLHLVEILLVESSHLLSFCRTVSCLACQSHPFVARLGRTQLGRGPFNTLVPSWINPYG